MRQKPQNFVAVRVEHGGVLTVIKKFQFLLNWVALLFGIEQKF